MEQTPHSSRRLLLVGLAAVVGLILVIALVAFLFAGTKKPSNTASTATATRVASKAEQNQSLNDLNATLKQANADQTAAKAALANAESQAKVAD